MRSVKINTFILLSAMLLVQTAHSQMYKVAPLRVEPPTLISQLIALKSSKPRMTQTEFSDAANVLLDRRGSTSPCSWIPRRAI